MMPNAKISIRQTYLRIIRTIVRYYSLFGVVSYNGHMPKNSKLSFPKKFLWGASTSAHQVEGGTDNQWTAWEDTHAKTLAAQAEYQWSDLENWEEIKRDAKNPDNYLSNSAVEHYQRYEQDFDLLKQLNMNAFRFSIEWSRVEPQQGAWNIEAVEHYKAYIAALKKRNIEPIVTLCHFTLPVWFSELGGFEKRANATYFADFAEKIVRELGISIKYIITINEPEVYAHESYLTGNWPPQRRSKSLFLKVLNNQLRAHREAAKRIHAINRRFKISIATNQAYVYAGDDALLSRVSARLADFLRNEYVLNRVKKSCDFIGLNYYFSDRWYGNRIHNPERRLNDLGWDMAPENLEPLLIRLDQKYGLPIIITENGLADADDAQRQWWLTKTLVAMQNALAAGVKLEGYLHWSLLDNFEWDKGFWPKFGLAAVDRKTMKRTLRPSARWFGAVLQKVRK